MTTTASGPVIGYDSLPDSVLYDIFAEASYQLSAAFIERENNAQDDTESAFWQGQLDDLRRERRSVNPRDRSQQIAAMENWRSRLSALAA